MSNEIKNRIRASFNKSWKSYDEYSLVQKVACEKAMAILAQQGREYNIIADFACGTGGSTQLLANQVEYVKLYAIDFSENLLDVAKKKYCDAKVNYVLADFDNRLFSENYLDMIFCNMGLQWSLNLKNTLDLFHSYLAKAGDLVFTLPLQGTFSELNEQYRNNFHSINGVNTLLHQCGYRLKLFHHEVHVDLFDTQIEAIRSIKRVGANCSLSGKDTQVSRISRDTIKDIFVITENTSLTYHIGLFVAEKFRGDV